MPSNERSPWGPVRIATWALAAYAVAFFYGPVFFHQFKPRDGQYWDFSQEWLSAKNFWSGTAVYADQRESLSRHAGITPENPEKILPWNAHPPAAVLLCLPFAVQSYPSAHLTWNLLTLLLFFVSVWLIVRELEFPLRIWSVFPAIVLLLLCGPIYYQVLLGQINFPILFLLTLAWLADRRDRPAWAGAALGIAAGLKLYPLFAFIYFLSARRWPAVLTGALAFLAVNGLALVVFGPSEFETYLREVIPSLSHYQSSWRNTSLNGFWLRIFEPHPDEKIIPLFPSHTLALAAVAISRLMVVVVLFRLGWTARTVAARDRAFAATIVGMLLVCPFTWTHYFTLLPLPLAIVWCRLPPGWERWLFWLIVIVLWSPENLFIGLVNPALAAQLNADSHEPLPAVLSVTVFAVFTYALLTLFILVLRVEPDPAVRKILPGENHS